MADLYSVIKGQQPNGKVTPIATTAVVLATGILTSDNTNVSVGDEVQIGTDLYTFVSLITSYGQVLIGSNADASLTNLAARINGGDAPNNVVTSSAVSSHALTFTAIDDGSGGAAGNQIVTTTTAAHLSWGAATLTGGAAGVLVTSVGGGGGGVGAANLAVAQVATATSQVAAAIARPTRSTVLFRNLDASITIYVGPTGVTSSNGVPILPGAGQSFTWVGAFFAVSASGTPTLLVTDEYG